MIFFDGPHDFGMNIETFQKILPQLSPCALIVVHDTGLWNKALFSAAHSNLAREFPGGWVTGSTYAHQPDEQLFVDWILDSHKEFGAVNFHSLRKLRHGFTVLQRQSSLAKEAVRQCGRQSQLCIIEGNGRRE